MKEVKAYEALDGAIFKTIEECEAHEKVKWAIMFRNNVEAYCPTTYCDDFASSVIEPSDVCDYIISNWEYIQSMMADYAPR